MARDEYIDQHIDRVIDSLTDRFSGVHDRQTVLQAVNDARAHLESEARVVKYLPVLVSKRAVDQLAARRSMDPGSDQRAAR
jgi:hypothetical protein